MVTGSKASALINKPSQALQTQGLIFTYKFASLIKITNYKKWKWQYFHILLI